MQGNHKNHAHNIATVCAAVSAGNSVSTTVNTAAKYYCQRQLSVAVWQAKS